MQRKFLEELGLEVRPEQVMIHLNTFHTKEDLHKILDTCKSLGIKYLLVISGDGSERLPKLRPSDIGVDMDKIGLDGSPTRVVKTAPPPPRNTVAKRIEGSPEDCAKQLVQELRIRSIL